MSGRGAGRCRRRPLCRAARACGRCRMLGTAVGILLTYGAQMAMKYYPGNLVQETVYGWWPIAGGIAVVGALLGAVVPGLKAVKQDVTEALSYE